MNEKLRKTVISAVFAALICAVTMLIQIPTLTKGYVNLGDGIVLIAGWVCGAKWGAAAAGIGSALADIFSGYYIYAPGTFAIKALMAVVAAAVSYAFTHREFTGHIISAVSAELVMAFGYFLYEWLFITGTFETAIVGLPENLVQAAFGTISSVAIMTALERTKAVGHLRFK
ncbi:MAG: ECF transporter S component [Ruminiclostridium sp.]|nr:ECF transporter S component [Ruminiclostridium sp.]